MTEKEIIEEIKKGTPFEGLSDISISAIEEQPKITNSADVGTRPDIAIGLYFASIYIEIYGEIKIQVTPKVLKELGPWLVRLQSLDQKRTYAIISPYLSPECQKYCQENSINFIDLSGNVLLRVPGSVLIQRLERPNRYKQPRLLRNPFGGAASRVVRLLLQFPKQKWTVTKIEGELAHESERQKMGKALQLSISSISKTIQALEEEVLIRRDGLKIIVPDPKQLLFRWAERYQYSYKWARRSSWVSRNPFGFDVESSIKGLNSKFKDIDSVVTGTAAASFIAPYANIDRIDVFILRNQVADNLKISKDEQSVGTDFLFMYPYDEGVFMYSREINGIKVASDIQIYLDCNARGSRDAKQAEYLLSNVIEKQWKEV